jgi:hypothetical protein
MRIVLATSFDNAFQGIGEYAGMSMHLYGVIHNISVRVDPNASVSDRPTPWHRVKLIQQLFNEGYDIVIWMDADAIITRYDCDIRSLLKPDKDLYLVQHDNIGEDGPVPNTGFMILKNTDWSKSLLQEIWNKEEYINHKWWENAALIDILGYKHLLGGVRSFDNEMLAKVEFISSEWNYVPMREVVAKPIINHFAGFTREERLKLLSKSAMQSIKIQAENMYPEKKNPWWRRLIK